MGTLIQQDEARGSFILPEDGCYLNCANMSPLLKTVESAGQQALVRRAAPWNLTSRDWFDDGEVLRGLAAQLFKCSADDVALVPSASYGLALAAQNLQLKAGQSILILEDQFPSNYYLWVEVARRQQMNLVVVKRAPYTSLTDSLLKAINDDTGLVAIPNVHWTDGALIDLKVISHAVKQAGAHFVLDLSQSLGAVPVDIREIDPDFAVSVGYKWQLGPYGLGYLFVSPRFHSGDPLEYTWQTRKGAEDFTKLTQYNSEYKVGARKFDMGEYSQLHTMPMSIAALKQLLEWGVPNINATIQKLTKVISEFKINQKLVDYEMPGAGHMIGVPLQKLNQDAIKARLKEKGIVVSFRGATIRVSPHVYNTADEVAGLLGCIY